MRLLFLTPQFPYPPHKGTTLRNYNLIAGLAPRHEIDLLSFAESAPGASPLTQLCRRIATVALPRRPTWRRALDTVLSPWPDMGLRLWSKAYRQQLAAWLRDSAYEVIQIEGLELARYAPSLDSLSSNDPALARRREKPLVVFDDHNAEYLLQKRIAEAELAARGWNAGAVYSSIQWRKLRSFERRVCCQSDRVACVSPADADAIRQLDPAIHAHVIPNGVDTDFYRRERVTPLDLPRHSLVFTGTMDFRPNVEAMLWFMQEVLPLIKPQVPDVQVYIVGQRPHARLDALRADPALTITGAVDDTRPYIAAASAYIVPLRMGGGTRLKLLEALALQAPIVSTTLGAEGFAVTHGRELLLADEAAAFARAIVELIEDRARAQALGAAGRSFAVQHYDWRSIVPQLEEAYRR
ncbi:MAG TPA: glycosyltransferase family 4 protein [Anaerolineae bacterium]|nr:glycosyltransferase family 4 protein [Anaerolineae bacterium]